MRALVTTAALFVISVGMWGCSGNGYSSGPGTPTSPTPPANDATIMTINVVAINGAQSFSPNPATVRSGQMVVWHNVDSVTHHVVLDDRSVDTGDLAPGASSQPMMIGAGGPYHCTIHPVMVGSINQDTSSSAPPACQGAYCS